MIPTAPLSAATLGVCLTACLVACTTEMPYNGELIDPPEPAPALVGTNWDGERFALSDLAGKTAIVFFGYTYCPDVCPLTLVKMTRLWEALDDRDDLAMVFASVDPGRDSVDKLSQYVPNFDPRFFGLRLDQEELDAAVEGWGLTVQYGQPKEGPGSDTFYYVDHTGTFFVVDGEGQLRLELPPNATLHEMSTDINRLLGS